MTAETTESKTPKALILEKYTKMVEYPACNTPKCISYFLRNGRVFSSFVTLPASYWYITNDENVRIYSRSGNIVSGKLDDFLNLYNKSLESLSTGTIPDNY